MKLPAFQFPLLTNPCLFFRYDGVSQLLVENPLNRYLLNSAMLPSMKVAEDGSSAMAWG